MPTKPRNIKRKTRILKVKISILLIFYHRNPREKNQKGKGSVFPFPLTIKTFEQVLDSQELNSFNFFLYQLIFFRIRLIHLLLKLLVKPRSLAKGQRRRMVSQLLFNDFPHQFPPVRHRHHLLSKT